MKKKLPLFLILVLVIVITVLGVYYLKDYFYNLELAQSPSESGSLLTSESSGTPPQAVYSEEVIEWNIFEIDLDVFLTDERIIFEPNFGQEPLSLIRTKVEGTLEDELRWQGFVEDSSGNNLGEAFFVIRKNGKGIVATIIASNYFYKILSLGDGRVVVMPIDPELFPELIDDIILPPELEVETAAENREALSGGPYYIDVLVPYSSIAEQEVGGEQNMLALISSLEMQTNNYFYNSQVTEMILRVVGTVRVDYNGPSATDFLINLQDPIDGVLDEIPILRNQLNADLVAGIYHSGPGHCGLAYLMTAYNMNYFNQFAYTTSSTGCGIWIHNVFAHEIGHNMGLCHDWLAGCGTTDLIYPYNYGHYFGGSGAQYGTVMSYHGDMIPHFSNPDVLYDGYPTGVPPPQQYQAASAWGLNNIAYHVSQFRTSTPPTLRCGDIIYENTVMDSDLLNCYDGLFVVSSGITLDCLGHTISGSNIGGVGIFISNKTNVEIKNCKVQNFQDGIRLWNSDSNTLTNNTASNNSIGINLDSSSNNIITSNTANSNERGISLLLSDSNILTSNTVNSNEHGISLKYSDSNTLALNFAISNSYGIWVSGSTSNNLIYNNYFNNTINAYDIGTNSWNTTLDCSQPNIIGRQCIGGNFWHDYTGQDLDGDGIGDTNIPYNSNGGIQNGGDYLPLIPRPCGDTITSDTTLNNDLLNCPNNGIIIGASGITLDCNGHTIVGTGSSNYGEGISVLNKQNVEIKNCNVQGFEYAINLSSSSNNILTNNIVTNFNLYGISLGSTSNNNILTDNMVELSYQGIRLHSSSNNTLTNNTVSSNHYGISLDSASNNNILTDNMAESNNRGINLDSSSNNILTNNLVDSNARGIYISDSSNNLIYNNYFENWQNTNNAFDDGFNSWNTTKTLGPNIVGGKYIAGNFWSDYSGADTNGDGIGDTNIPYNSNGNIQNGGDYLPLVEGEVRIRLSPEDKSKQEKIKVTSPIEKAGEKFVDFFYTFRGKESKIERDLHIAEKRVEDAKAYALEKKDKKAESSLKEYDKRMNKAVTKAEKLVEIDEEKAREMIEKILNSDNEFLVSFWNSDPEGYYRIMDLLSEDEVSFLKKREEILAREGFERIFSSEEERKLYEERLEINGRG